MMIYLDNDTQKLLEKYDIHNVRELEAKRFLNSQLLRLYLAITDYSKNNYSHK